MTNRTPADTDRLRLAAAEDQATAAAAPLLRLDVPRATTRELDAARLTLGAAKLAVRRLAIADGKNVDPEAGRTDRATILRLRPYTDVLEAIRAEEERRQADAGNRRRAVYDARRAAATPAVMTTFTGGL